MGLDNLDQNYFDPNGEGDNHPWGSKENREQHFKEQNLKYSVGETFMKWVEENGNLFLEEVEYKKRRNILVEKLNEMFKERLKSAIESTQYM